MTKCHNLTAFPAGSRNGEVRYEVIKSHTETRCCRSEQYTVRVPDGESCTTVRVDNGNGGMTTRRECTPRYRNETRTRQVNYNVEVDDWGDRYYFEIQRWRHSRNIDTNGNSINELEPTWADYVLQVATDSNDGEYEREVARRANYCVRFTYNVSEEQSESEGTEHTECTADQQLWMQYRREPILASVMSLSVV